MPQRCLETRGPTVVTNKPIDAVRRVLHTMSMKGRVPSKYRLLRSAQIAASDSVEQGRSGDRDIVKLSQLFLKCRCKQRHHNLVMANQGVAHPTFLCRPTHHVCHGTIVRYEIHIHGGDLREGVAKVAA